MPRELHERTFEAALTNEFQWRNLYLKEFGCCTYPPPVPKDPSTTASGVYPTRRQVILLQHESSSSSSSEGAENEVEDDDHEESAEDTDREDVCQPNTSSVFSQVYRGGDSDACKSRRHQAPNSDVAAAEAPSMSSSRRSRTLTDQFFSLDMSISAHDDETSARSSCRPSYRSSRRRSGHGAVLRKDDFFDTNDVFSTKFFSFLWLDPDNTNDDNEEDASDGRAVDYEGRWWEARDSANERGMGRGLPDRSDRGRLTLSRSRFSTLASHTFNENPRGLPEAVLHLHHQTWALLMDNRLMAWVHREAADHCQRATQLRHHLLQIIARGPSSADIAGGSALASPTRIGPALALTQEDALQRTLESFSPFFLVIAPPAALQRAKDQFRAARRAQYRSNNKHTSAAASAADLVGLPLLSQYSSWRETYEHRHYWDKTPFSFFFIHDVSYNYAQVTAVFVELQLLYTHSHHHSRRCLETRREPVLLKNAGRQLSSFSTSSPTAEEQRQACPLILMQEMTENIVLAYEQSSARTTLPMLCRVLDFLTDAALDVVTAHRFISRQALLRQHQFRLPGMTSVQPLPTLPKACVSPTTPAATADKSQATESGEATAAVKEKRSRMRGLCVSRSESSPFGKDDCSCTDASGISLDLEPQRVTERDINELFEVAYWFLDATTANARVPLDPAALAGTTAALSALGGELPNSPLAVSKRGSRAFPGNAPLLDMSADRAGMYHSPGVGTAGRGAPLSMFHTVRAEEPLLAGQHPSNALPLADAYNLQLSSPLQWQYLPGRTQVYKPVEFLVEAVALLEAYRKPLSLHEDRFFRVGRRKRQSVVSTDVRARRGDPVGKRFTSPSFTPAPFTEAFTSLMSPLVVLTTYIRLHGSAWLKHLCQHVFELLRRPSVLLYVNTLELDTVWASLQPAPPSPAQETIRPADPPVPRGRQPRQSPLSEAGLPAQNAAANSEVARRDFLYGLHCLEDLICQDILYVLNDFFGFLYGKRAAAARLPQGISVLLTQFVSTVHLYMLESVGVTRATAAAASGNSNRNPPLRTASGANSSTPRGATAADAPSRIVEDCLRLCKQHYYAGVRRRVGAGERGEVHGSAFRGADNAVKSARGGASAGAMLPPSEASLPRLLQMIEQHRLAKFILFDCWILPALNNAISLGYLAPDSPLHLRWNIDALARYLKVLVHAPFVEQDKQSFASLSSASPRGSGRGIGSGLRCNDGVDGSSGRGADKQHGSSSSSGRASTQASGRGAARPMVLTLPPYLTGIYDVATGSLVRMQTSILSAATAGRTPSDTLLSAAAAAVHPTELSAVSSTLSSTAMSGTPESELANGDALPTQCSANTDEDVPVTEGTPTQGSQSEWTLESTALPPSLSATHDTSSRAPRQRHSKGPRAGPLQDSVTAAIMSTAASPSSSSSRLLSVEEETAAAAKEVFSPPADRDTDSCAVSQRDLHDDLPTSSLRAQRSTSDTPFDGIKPTLASPSARLPPLDYTQGAVGSTGSGNSAAVALAHPYVVMDHAVWLDMSPVLQSLNKSIGLTYCDRGTGEELLGDNGSWESMPRLPTPKERGGIAESPGDTVGRPELTASAGPGRVENTPSIDVPALQMLNAFTYAAYTDDSEYVVLSEFEVLPSMAAGCLERLYEFASGAHPMVTHALQKGSFHFAYSDGGSVAPDMTSLYTACMNGVLLHPRTAALVLRNAMDNNAPFSRTLLKPVTDTTALDLSSLVTHSRAVPMVDVNAVVPLIHSMVPARGGAGGGGRRPYVKKDSPSNTGVLPAVGAADTNGASASEVISHRWERESRRLLREFVFLTTGYADSGPPLPLVPGLRRPVGPPHPMQIIRAGAARITEDAGGMTPMVFDPWWRAMVVALCVKVSNMFAECSGDQSVSFQEMCHAQAEESRRLNRDIVTRFVATKGRETCETDASSMLSGLPQRQTSVSLFGSGGNDPTAWPSRKLKRKSKVIGGVAASGRGAATSTTKKRRKQLKSTATPSYAESH
ncbi:hypothetical protein LSCM1_06037 [Leishmania martiniquensis]|uniref:Uncharacterized protein n=1 Tax=Leishmania martiniquensis TaxID=1580590 RepID=A0A836GR97_9TRYP|nr:hypothetical protein LSCM1_06037 [Leishmania martiniquensis]